MPSFARLFRHFLMTGARVRSTFPSRTLQAIEDAVTTTEKTHGGEIRFAVEGELSTQDLWQDLAPRARALEVFGQLGIWDTAENNGVLIYVLLADRDVEIVADRGFTGKVAATEWTEICTSIEQAFRSGEFERGAIDGIVATGKLIARHFPAIDRNELPDSPVLL